ncbi:hypothetical protein G7Y89_g14866 [Cudoniella acicularis]|uniref:Ubiquitin-like domain-containing protein n=1 Tax=Cudoniella acicularis TaxID=354080 RepID=A0A8H4QYF3_9HELO|nr:hypothetical protein G7Y89_g14866 [Cudoniella acicularis]
MSGSTSKKRKQINIIDLASDSDDDFPSISATSLKKSKTSQSQSPTVKLESDSGIGSPSDSDASVHIKSEPTWDERSHISNATYDIYSKLVPRTSVKYLHSPRFVEVIKKAAIQTRVTIIYNVTIDQAVEEFRRLIALKTFYKDQNAEMLSPTPLMDTLWHAAILDTRFYAELQKALGCVLHHRPEGASDNEAEARKLRLASMEALYTVYFTSKPSGSEVVVPVQKLHQPNTPPALNPLNGPRELPIAAATIAPSEQVPTPAPASQSGNMGEDKSQSDKITVSVREHNMVTFFRIRRTTPVEKLCKAYLEKHELSWNSRRILYDGKRVEVGKSLQDHGIEDSDIIEVYLEQNEC